MRAGGWAIVLPFILAGCMGATDAPQPPASRPDDVAEVPNVVIGLVDSGINAYHLQFRDHGPNAWRHPSLYLPGYPADAEPLRLNLNATDWSAAVAADCQQWNGLRAEALYWIPGTRIIGLRVSQDWVGEPVDCAAGELPTRGLDTLAPHGTGAAGRAAGMNTSLCPDCRIVMSQGRQMTDPMLWMAKQAWVDVQSNSWGGPFCEQLPVAEAAGCGRGDHSVAREATELQVTFASSGNAFKVTDDDTVGIGIPAYLKAAQGHEGVILVGGHDNGQVIAWPGSMPHVVADAWSHPAPAWNATSGDQSFGGTSGAAPFAAGVFARTLLEARKMMGDVGTGLRGEDLALAGPGFTAPAQGPLADGVFGRLEAERLLMATAIERPQEEQPFDGELGCPFDPPSGDICVAPWTNDFGPWEQVPTGVPAYYFIGYGQVGERSLKTALDVLNGTAPQPARPLEDAFFQADAEARRTLQE